MIQNEDYKDVFITAIVNCANVPNYQVIFFCDSINDVERVRDDIENIVYNSTYRKKFSDSYLFEFIGNGSTIRVATLRPQRRGMKARMSVFCNVDLDDVVKNSCWNSVIPTNGTRHFVDI